ncbi:hypothetical protein [Zoogloea sp.]|uniref:hypothetical protein n=1 Tax=Zoogloea sp. TaxID=49181 RepID=UPI0025898D11|nr:hypothetical protein [Zoogloea sp.]MDD2668760.1 hypothetical protein [Zoogloea sp.]
MTDPISMTDYAINIDGTTYNMLKVPGQATPVVVEERARILRNIDLDAVINGLSQSADLIYLAHNAVAGFGDLRAGTVKLHDDFLRLGIDTNLLLNRIDSTGGTIINKLTWTFTFLTQYREAQALDFLAMCGKEAAALAAQSHELSKRYDTAGDDAIQILRSTYERQHLETEKKKQLETQTNDLEAKTARATTLVKQLGTQKKRLESLYMEAKRKSESAEQRAFMLAITSAVMKPIADGIGAFGAVYSGGALAGVAKSIMAPPLEPMEPANDPALKKKEEELEQQAEVLKQSESEAATQEAAATKASTEKTDKEARASELAEKTREAETKLKAAQDDAEKAKFKASLETRKAEEKQAATDAAAARQRAEKAAAELEAARKKQELAKASVDALQKSLSAASEKLQHMANDYNAVAAQYATERTSYLKLIMQKEDMEADTLACIQEYAVRMKNISTDVNNIDLACTSLFQAIGALKQVAVSLRLAAAFWANMADACSALADNDLTSLIKTVANLEKEMRKDFYTSDLFKEQTIRYFAAWVGIRAVANDYAEQASMIVTRTADDFSKNLDGAEARALAVKLGGEVLDKTTSALETNARRKLDLEEALKDKRAAA